MTYLFFLLLCVPFKQREFTTNRELVSKFSAVSPFLTKGINSWNCRLSFRLKAVSPFPTTGINSDIGNKSHISDAVSTIQTMGINSFFGFEMQRMGCFYHPDDGNQQQPLIYIYYVTRINLSIVANVSIYRWRPRGGV